MNIVGRSGWGAQPARSVTPLSPGRVELFVVHHTTGTYAGPETVRSIQRFHMQDRGWADVGYNFLVGSDGTVFEGCGWSRVGAHARNKNSVSIGVAYIGDGRLPVSDEVRRSLAWLAQEADRRFGSLRRVGHRDVGSTVCPGDVLYGFVQQGVSLPVAEFEDARERVVCPPVAVSPVPDLRDGWKRFIDRFHTR